MATASRGSYEYILGLYTLGIKTNRTGEIEAIRKKNVW